eukprot:GILJ01008951.1.p1 GENE.GILJ01008951.1~~GILJ01008951.1.p1  ORF type:complete len:282 (-),score=28.36 GILJ01008951.1:701-1519(-)
MSSNNNNNNFETSPVMRSFFDKRNKLLPYVLGLNQEQQLGTLNPPAFGRAISLFDSVKLSKDPKSFKNSMFSSEEKMRRVQSVPAFAQLGISEEEAQFLREQLIKEQLKDLQLEIAKLKRTIQSYNEESGQWLLRYIRRVAVSSNFLLGLWVFVARFVLHIKLRSRLNKILNEVLVKRKHAAYESLFRLTYEGILRALFRSSPLFLSAILLNRSSMLVRTLGLLLSCSYSLFLAFGVRFMPWVCWFNVLFTSAHVIARYYHQFPSFGSVQML